MSAPEDTSGLFGVAAPAGLADALAIRLLFGVYCHRIDQGTPGDIARLFAPEAVLALSFCRPASELAGRDAIAGWFAGYMRETRRESRHNRHSVAGVCPAVSGDRAYAQTWWDASGINRASGALHQLRGFYRDWLVRTEGHWFFGRREIHIWDSRQSGTATVIRPEPTIPRLAMTVWSYATAWQTYFAANA